jgi:hypothetical protein
LYAVLPYRVSLGRYVGCVKKQNAAMFGAPARGQWPPWAVRRFFLYDVLLHELGHLQLVNPKSKHWDRKYADEKLAQEFADYWRAELWQTVFEHPDPVHHPPRDDEMETIVLWERLDKRQRFQLVRLALGAPHARMPDLAPFGPMHPPQQRFLARALCYQDPPP